MEELTALVVTVQGLVDRAVTRAFGSPNPTRFIESGVVSGFHRLCTTVRPDEHTRIFELDYFPLLNGESISSVSKVQPRYQDETVEMFELRTLWTAKLMWDVAEAVSMTKRARAYFNGRGTLLIELGDRVVAVRFRMLWD